MRFVPSRARCATLIATAIGCAFPIFGQAQVDDQQVVVTGSVVERALRDAPYAISVIDSAALRSSGPLINLSEAMARVPGLTVANRNNYAQDLQISSRGFGARAGFGVRGLRLYTDGIPASMPDGQGQVSHFALAGADRIEVLRGPFSVLYGNSSGGVIALISAPVRAGSVELGGDAGSFGLAQTRVSVAAPIGEQFELRASAAAVEWEGFRPRSSASKKSGAVRVAWRGSADTVVLQMNALDQPAQDPLGLSRAQFDADPYQTTPQATQFDTRKTTRQTQAGLQWKHRFGGGGPLSPESTVTLFSGERAVAQWLAIAATTQDNLRHGGGVIDFDRRFGGLDARLTWRGDSVDVVAGVATERQEDDRRGYLNYTGTVAAPLYGQTGSLRRDETNRARTNDAYAQLEWRAADAWGLSAGLRHGRVTLEADDRYLTNGDDSGARRLPYTTPVLGLRWSATPALTLHASAARGFESPTLGELAYRFDSSGGFNLTLLPQKSRQFELGAKLRSGALSLDAALFRIDVDDEIGVASNAGGRQSFQNVGRTQRRGAELSLAWTIARHWRAQLAATWLDATYRDGFLTCAAIPCNAPDLVIPAGNRIAGTQRQTAYAELAWQPRPGTDIGVELKSASALVANDSNSQAAPSHTLLALRASHRYTLMPGFTLDVLARLDNLADKVYAGSVIVNDANGRFYETGAPRAWWLGARLAWSF